MLFFIPSEASFFALHSERNEVEAHLGDYREFQSAAQLSSQTL